MNSPLVFLMSIKWFSFTSYFKSIIFKVSSYNFNLHIFKKKESIINNNNNNISQYKFDHKLKNITYDQIIVLKSKESEVEKHMRR